mmetsp:Transcript_98789/g.205933  ORF Transcript_98789/g.205933 Transcript_98789/m.205933 type:complete len:342 (+) Transcript_98789:68-1093(+)
MVGVTLSSDTTETMSSETRKACTAWLFPTLSPENDIPKGAAGCRHYRRRCRIVAPCCGETYWCRHCHNDAQSGHGASSHEVDRRAIREVQCLRCSALVPPGKTCRSCNQTLADYFCGTCNLWDDEGDEKKIFHCSGCGICRLGGRDRYFHCDTCGSCYPTEISATHTCVENAMRQNCPICMQDLFQSTLQVTILDCGHTIHQGCLLELQTSFAGLQSLRCPICGQSLYKYDNLWAKMDRQVAEMPMPFEELRLVDIICNDCRFSGKVCYHVLGHKCLDCGSYNTRQTQTQTQSSSAEEHEQEQEGPEETLASVVERREQRRLRRQQQGRRAREDPPQEGRP